MRRTFDIPDAIYQQLKSKAAAEKTTVNALMLEAVDLALAPPAGPIRKKLKLPLIESRKPGTLDIDNERIYDLIDFP